VKSGIKIVSELYKLIDVEPLKSNISGDILIGEVGGGNDDMEHITLNCLTNPNQYLQVGLINLNIYVPRLKSGRANALRFKEIFDLVEPLVDDVEGNGVRFDIVDDKGVFKDQDRDLMYFNNIRIEFKTFKNS